MGAGHAQLPPRRHSLRASRGFAPAADPGVGGGHPRSGETPGGLRRSRRGDDRPGDPKLLPGPHVTRRQQAVSQPGGALSLRRGGRLCRRDPLRRRGRSALRGGADSNDHRSRGSPLLRLNKSEVLTYAK